MRGRHIVLLVAVSFVTAFISGGSAALAAAAGTQPAAQQSITQELHVTAIVPPMRHIMLSPTGQIMKITSNTLDDITPAAYLGNDVPGNERPLTPELMQAYRKLVPAGTAAYGILYEQTAILARMTPAESRPQPSAGSLPALQIAFLK